MTSAHDHQISLPFVTVKVAASLDGRIATATGDSQWISSPATLKLAHRLRRDHDAILVGIGTVLADNPQLNVRLVKGPDPLRVVIDSQLRVPSSARLLSPALAARTVILTTRRACPRRVRQVQATGARVVILPAMRGTGRVNLNRTLEFLATLQVQSFLIEGGAGIITAFLKSRLVNRLVMVLAPKVIGTGIEAIGDLGIRKLGDAITFSSYSTHRMGPDLVFDGTVAQQLSRSHASSRTRA